MHKNSLREPQGHSSPETKIERYWRGATGPLALTRKRILAFDVNALMTFSPMEYTLESFELPSEPPSLEWIEKNFKDFVRTEFDRKLRVDGSIQSPTTSVENVPISFSFLEGLLKQSLLIQPATPSFSTEMSASTMAEKIYDLLCNQKYASSANRENNEKKSFIEGILPVIKNRSRLLIVFPGFPFKDQNIFRIPYEPDEPDFSEIAFLFRLHRLTQALYQIHPYGVDVVVLTDGTLYGDIFGVGREAILNYMRRLIGYRNRYNLQGTVSFIPLRELIDHASPMPASCMSAWSLVSIISHCLKERIHSDSELQHLFSVLVAGMKWNTETRCKFQGLDAKVCWNLICGEINDIAGEHQALWKTFDNSARDAALNYASVNLMLRWTDLIRQFFPNAIRGTIHPKRGQFALSGSSSTYAWNGVAWCDKWPTTIEDIQVKPYYTLAEFGPIKKVLFEETGLPAFFTKVSLPSNMVIAQTVLPKNGWILDAILGCEFTENDLETLVELAKGDRHFTWGWVDCDQVCCERLLRFRINHYRQYGFGVHCLWSDGRMIGQCGLQVFDPKSDEVEFVIYLGKDYTRKGIGVALGQYVFRRCAAQGLMTVFGTVRPQNEAGIALLRRLGGKEEKQHITHFEHEAIKFRFDLREEE